VHRLRGGFPPLIAFVVHRAFVAACAASQGYAPLSGETYSRWDSGFYLEIAARGYAPLFHCTPATGYPVSAWCGNAGWFPGYSWAIAPLLRCGMAPATAGFLVAAIAELFCLGVVWGWSRNRVELSLATFFPGNIYLAAVFPQALFVMFAVVCLWGCSTGRTAVAAAAGCGAALCHPLGILLAPITAWWWVADRRTSELPGPDPRSARGWMVPCRVVLGYALVLFVLRVQAGRWDAYFAIQSKYGYRLSFGVDSLLSRLKPIVNPRYWNAKSVASALQTLLCASLVVSLVVDALKRLREERPDGEPGTPLAERARNLVLLYTLLFWAAPLTLGGQLSLYRSELLLLPAAFLVPSLPRRVQYGFLVAAVAVSVPMNVLFFRGVLV
jgi:hypothetical protein